MERCGYNVTCLAFVFTISACPFFMKMKLSLSYINISISYSLLRQSQYSICPKKTRNLYGSPTSLRLIERQQEKGTHSVDTQTATDPLTLQERISLPRKELETTIETSKNIQLQHLVWCGQITSSSSTFPFLLSISFRTALSTKRLKYTSSFPFSISWITQSIL